MNQQGAPASNAVLRGTAAKLASELRAGCIYRREDLARLSTSVDRHLRQLTLCGRLRKLAQMPIHRRGQACEILPAVHSSRPQLISKVGGSTAQ